jgi:ATP-binding cassette subfamily B protein
MAFIWHFLKQYKGFVLCFAIAATLAGFQDPFSSLLIKSLINTLATSQAENPH